MNIPLKGAFYNETLSLIYLSVQIFLDKKKALRGSDSAAQIQDTKDRVNGSDCMMKHHAGCESM